MFPLTKTHLAFLLLSPFPVLLVFSKHVLLSNILNKISYYILYCCLFLSCISYYIVTFGWTLFTYKVLQNVYALNKLLNFILYFCRILTLAESLRYIALCYFDILHMQIHEAFYIICNVFNICYEWNVIQLPKFLQKLKLQCQTLVIMY